MKRVAIVGLYSIPNMGDKILCETAEFLAKSIKSDIEIVNIDVCPRYAEDYKGIEYIKYRIARKMKTRAETKFQYEDSGEDRYHYEYRMWSIRLNRYYRKAFKNVDAIIFAGGGFLKFRTQGLNYYVEQIIKIAQERNIPVMMNSVGIEGYDEHDIRCQKLKEVINKDCVKVITTRDDVEILQNNYVINPNIITGRAGDPAFWVPECYGVSRNPEAEVIGVNVIRGKVFQDYGNQCSQDELLEFYKEFLRLLEKKGLKWVLFSNGMKSDQVFGRTILKELSLPIKEHLLPAPKTSLELLNMIKDFKYVFGTRLHACITAYSMDVPIAGLIWNEKTRIFSEMIGKADNFFEEKDMDAEEILNYIVQDMDNQYNIEVRNNLKNLTKDYMTKFLIQV